MELIAEQLAAVTERCRELGWIEANTELQQPSPAGDGNMNRTLRVHLQGGSSNEPATLILKQAVPFVAKYPDIAAPLARGASEAAFYGCIAQDDVLTARTPTLYGFDPEHHLLCLQDLGGGADMTSLYQIDSDSQRPGDAALSELVQWLARLHALPISAGDFPDNQAMRVLNHEHIFALPFNPESGVALPAQLAELRATIAADAPLLARIHHLGELYLGQANCNSRPALLHGDFYPGSWLANSQMDSRVIDPEFGFVGPAEFDVGVMLAHLTFAGYEPSARDQLLSNYQPPPGFEARLAQQFCAVEILRRLLGVAQLPLGANEATQVRWAQSAHTALAEAS